MKKIATQLRALKGCPANSSVRGCTARLAVAVLSFFANKGKANVLLNEPQQVGLSVAVRGDGTVLKQSTRHLVSHASRAIFCHIPPMSDICRHPGGVESPGVKASFCGHQSGGCDEAAEPPQLPYGESPSNVCDPRSRPPTPAIQHGSEQPQRTHRPPVS